MYKFISVIVIVIVLLTGCASSNLESVNNSSNNHSASNSNQLPVVDIDPQQTVNEVIDLIKNKDFPRFAAYVHPTMGVRFSPYGYVNTDNDVIMQASVIQNAMEDDSIIGWGSYAGSGEPIDLTFTDYYDKFIYSHDFVNADQVGYNTIIGIGNTINNASDIYPDSYIAEYHFKGTEANNNMDWSSLKIVLVEHDNDWVVVGIIHDQWTI